jgi:CheY-like chemotaxis protein/cytochrome c-type biogenesis protein CcmH/NrfG
MAIDLRHKRFLIIDDFGDMRSMIRHMVESYGAADIDMAANGKEAIKLMSRHRYDVVLCDYNLGEGQDGQQILEEARHRQLIGYATLFIMITAENTAQMVMGAVEYYPDDYLSKPFNKLVLKTRLERILARKGDLTELDRAIARNDVRGAIEFCDLRISDGTQNTDELQRIKCELCFQCGDYSSAQLVCEAVLAQRRVPWALLGLGKALHMLGRQAEAKDVFQSIIDENQNHTEAYDWLAQVMLKLGDPRKAQEVLMAASELSPKAIRRQMSLGDVAMSNQDYDVAERAFRKAVSLGRHSVHRTAENYIKQARAMSHGSGRDALKVIKGLRKDFPKDKEAHLRAALTESELLRHGGHQAEAVAAFSEALSLYDELAGDLQVSVDIEMSQACFQNGEESKAEEIIRRVVANHHDDTELLVGVEAMFSALGREAEGRKIIDGARQTVVDLNNNGVRLAEAGRLDEAIALFQQALDDLPANKTINMNAAKVLLMHMRSHGQNDRYQFQAREYLDRVARMDPGNAVQQELYALFDDICGASRRTG